MSYLKQNDSSKDKEARLCVSVIWFQYLHPENVKQSSHVLLPAKKEKNTHKI